MATKKRARADAGAAVSLAPKKGGRPRVLSADAATLKQLRGLGRLQCTTKEAAAFLGVTEPTFIKFKRDNPDAAEAFARGADEGKISLRRIQMRLAEKNAAMAIFLGKNLLGQTDRHEHSGPGGGGIPIDLARLTPEERRRRIAELEAKRRESDGADRR